MLFLTFIAKVETFAMAAVAVATPTIIINVAIDTNVGVPIFKEVVISCRQKQLLLILLL